MTSIRVLSAEDLESFVRDGYVRITDAFPATVAEACRKIIWARLRELSINEEEPGLWPRRQGLQDVFHKDDGEPWCGIFTERLLGAIDDVCGQGSWNPFGAGWWTISFPGYCNPPWGVDGNWHVDGSSERHYIFSKAIGLVPIMLFSDVHPGSGGTAVARGSHKLVINALVSAGLRGMSGPDVKSIFEDHADDFEVVELCGSAGTVYLMHPYLLHARSKNLSATPRFICHPSVSLRNHLDFSEEHVTCLKTSFIECVRDSGCTNPLLFITPQRVAEFHNRDSATSDSTTLILSSTEYREDSCENGNDENYLDEMEQMMGFSSFKKARYG
jgi:hypothetical protein